MTRPTDSPNGGAAPTIRTGPPDLDGARAPGSPAAPTLDVTHERTTVPSRYAKDDDVSAPPPAGAHKALSSSRPPPPSQEPAPGKPKSLLPPLHRRGSGRSTIVVLGPKQSGKTYLFQALLYRTADPERAGAFAGFAGAADVAVAQLHDGAEASPLNVAELLDSYRHWKKLSFTSDAAQAAYAIELRSKGGFFRRNQPPISMCFADLSGELLQSPITDLSRPVWDEALGSARALVFCLPIWAVFPGEMAHPAECQKVINDFENVWKNYESLREKLGTTPRVLALTMADDDRSALSAVRQRWIGAFERYELDYLRAIRRGSGLSRYLADARRMSEQLYEEWGNVKDATIRGIRARFFGSPEALGCVAVSALDGNRFIEYDHSNRPELLPPPVPVHVELPFLLALCEFENMFM